jgi:hypothetical protein
LYASLLRTLKNTPVKILPALQEALGLVDIRVLDHLLGGFCSVTTAVKTINRPAFAVSVTNTGSNSRMVTLLNDLSANFAQAGTVPR